ncbi:CLUMA_CG005871, isoform A [Clunio marinus]|uniref:CLUMA_CG005871, isoform A n=1 Tax=Clunio marinus TaxID=568069 RepID=A0A1J1HWF1_9DIPT|nr:CLUMA_CG005871, isoform A [Clunio marinus]
MLRLQKQMELELFAKEIHSQLHIKCHQFPFNFIPYWIVIITFRFNGRVVVVCKLMKWKEEEKAERLSRIRRDCAVSVSHVSLDKLIKKWKIEFAGSQQHFSKQSTAVEEEKYSDGKDASLQCTNFSQTFEVSPFLLLIMISKAYKS